METIAIFLYVLFFPLTLFENMMVVRPFGGTRPIWFHGDNQTTCQIVSRLIAVVSVSLIWWQFAFMPALAAFIAAIVFSRATFSFFYKSSFTGTPAVFKRILAEDVDFKNATPRQVSKEAMRIARDSIHESVKGNY